MLTPIDIQNHKLKSTMGGYNKKETDDFIVEIVASFEALYKENHDLKEKITSLSEGIQYYKQMESTLQKALVLAEKTSNETQEAAKSQADSLLREAKTQSESQLREATAQAEIMKSKANQQLEETRNHVRKLVQSYENYRLQFKKLAESQIEMLDSEAFSIFAPELDELLDDAPSVASAASVGSSRTIVVSDSEPEPPVVEVPKKAPVIEFISPDDEIPKAAAPKASTPKAATKSEAATSVFVDVGADVNEKTAEKPKQEKVFVDSAESAKPEGFVSPFIDETPVTAAFVKPDESTSETQMSPNEFVSPFVDIPTDTPASNKEKPETQSPFVDIPVEDGGAKKETKQPASPFTFIDPE